MRGSFRLGTFRGIPMRIHWSLIVIGLFLTFSLSNGPIRDAHPGFADSSYLAISLVGVVLFFGSVLAHEMAHAVVAQRNGLKVESIDLWLLGGMARFAQEAPTPKIEAKVAVAGPLASIAMGVIFVGAAFGLGQFGPAVLAASVIGWIGIVNLILAAFNLLPASPLDGGRILRAGLWARSGDRELAGITSARVGRLLGLAVTGFGVYELMMGRSAFFTVLVGWFIVANAGIEVKVLSTRRALRGRHIRDVTWFGIARAADWTDAETMLEQSGRMGKPGVVAVEGFGGNLRGLVTLQALRMIPEAMRPSTTLGQIAIGFDVIPRAGLDDDVVTMLDKAAGPVPIISVWDGPALVGVVTGDEVRRIVAHPR